MGSVQKISIALTTELASDIEAAVASGDYATTSEAVRDALRLWKRARADRAAVIGELRAAWHDGIVSAAFEPIDTAAIKAAGRRTRRA